MLVTKSDNIDSDQRKIINKELGERFPIISNKPFYFSTKSPENNKEILDFVQSQSRGLSNVEGNNFTPTINLRSQNSKKVKKSNSFYEILDKSFVQLAEGSDLSNWKALVQFQYKLKRSKLSNELNNLGIRRGDKLKISNYEFTWEE